MSVSGWGMSEVIWFVFLFGLCVFDMLCVLVGFFVGCLFSDLGVEVVKVELFEGDVMWKWGAQVVWLFGYYMQQNVGKRNVCVDLRVDGGSEFVV